MPELPEVETTIRELQPHVLGKRIEQVEIYRDSTVAAPGLEEFCRSFPGNRITGLHRRGKYLIFALDSGQYWIVHLRMTGALLVKSVKDEIDKHIRARICLDDGIALHFRDARCFGRMWLVADTKEVTGQLGIEPLEPGFTLDCLQNFLHNRNTPIKAILLRQDLIAGIGNMYADEALYRAGIHPRRPGNSLTTVEIRRLHLAIREVLRQGIDHKGASTETYIRPGGNKGEAHLGFQVAHQKGKACPACGRPIERIVVQQRGTFFCIACQR